MTSQSVMRASALLYVHLWVLEGAFRKWIPGTEQIMYVARDGIMLVALLAAGLLAAGPKRSVYGFWIAFFALGILTAVQITGGLSVIVGIVGLRSYIAPCLLVYGVWRYSPPGLLSSISRMLLIYAPLQLVITVLQVSQSPASIINKQVGSDVAYFVNDGIVRASGSFSSPAGLSLFAPLVLAVALGSLVRGRRASMMNLLPIAAILSCLGIGILGGARGTLLAVGIVLLGYLWFQAVPGTGGSVQRVVALLVVLIAVAVAVLLFFQPVLDSFIARFENASLSEDPFERLLRQSFGFLSTPVSLIGDGIGAHSQAGIAVGSAAGWNEIDSIKWVTELGLLGLILASAKILFSAVITFRLVFRASASTLMFMLIASALIPVLVYGPVSQYPSSQGFFSIGASLLLLAGGFGARSRETVVPELQIVHGRRTAGEAVRLT